jgi:carboxymethylenebutenolidase
VAHELFAVNPDIRAVLEELAAVGHLTIAPEFYHRHAPAGQWFERDDAGRAEGFRQLHMLQREHALADVSASRDWLLQQPGVDAVAMLGFSAGGHLAYLAATQLPIQQTVALYGGWLSSTEIPLSRPQPTLELTDGIGGELLYLVGDADALISREERTKIASALEKAGIRHEIVSYPGVQHAFFWPGTPGYDERARNDAWDKILRLLAPMAS